MTDATGKGNRIFQIFICDEKFFVQCCWLKLEEPEVPINLFLFNPNHIPDHAWQTRTDSVPGVEEEKEYSPYRPLQYTSDPSTTCRSILVQQVDVPQYIYLE